MLVFDFYKIGSKLFSIRKKLGLTQAEAAEAAGLSDRAYADIERGTANMRTETLLRICNALHITPDEILTESKETKNKEREIFEQFNRCTLNEKNTALKLLEVYLNSLNK
ncbi:MAG: helix-turn-helix transcriptional regulator [Clostridia bacterium]|nr:helix-turn-helix transcriptional regulator [Clostridia bacterium]